MPFAITPLTAKGITTACAALALTLGLSACTVMNKGSNPSLNSVRQPVVHTQLYTLDLAAGYDGIGAREQQRLAQWLETTGLRFGDKIGLDGPPATARVVDDVARQAARFGVALTDAVPVTEGSIAPGSVRVVISRSVATVPGCPDWSHRYSGNYGNNTSPNYGCAVNSNLAAMVANPDHLLTGATNDSQTVAMTASKAIDSYRTQPTTGSQPLVGVSTNEGASK